VKLKSKSILLKDTIEKVDEQLATIPTHDIQGCPVEDSTDFSMYVDSICEIKIMDESGKEHNPISNGFATALVHDEIKTKQQEDN
tara:strand:+ start:435 stop:689 length:255 start_codon:yes stop_codon:yes gene_type:complete